MVTVRRNSTWSIWSVDLACGALLASLVCASLWMLMVYLDSFGLELTNMKKELATTRQSLVTLQVANTTLQAKIKKQYEELDKQGTLPNHFPLGSYYRDLTQMATTAGVTVQSHIPMVEVEYPGLMEQRSQMAVSGSLQSILTFFEAIEQSSYWADIGYFSLAQGGGNSTSSQERLAKFTISMFSSRSMDDDPSLDGAS